MINRQTIPQIAPLAFVPRKVTNIAILVYVAALLTCNVLFYEYAMEWYFWIFGLVEPIPQPESFIKGFRGINPCAKVRRCGLFHDPLTPFPLPLAAVGVLTDYDTFASISIFVSV